MESKEEKKELFSFEDLNVWREAKQLAHSLYRLTFNINGRYNKVADQLRRAVLSISLNIAEGSSRGSKADFARFLNISLG